MRKTLPALNAPAAGGINPESITEYMSLTNVFAVGGSFMLKDDITETCLMIMNRIA